MKIIFLAYDGAFLKSKIRTVFRGIRNYGPGLQYYPDLYKPHHSAGFNTLELTAIN